MGCLYSHRSCFLLVDFDGSLKLMIAEAHKDKAHTKAKLQTVKHQQLNHKHLLAFIVFLF